MNSTHRKNLQNTIFFFQDNRFKNAIWSAKWLFFCSCRDMSNARNVICLFAAILYWRLQYPTVPNNTESPRGSSHEKALNSSAPNSFSHTLGSQHTWPSILLEYVFTPTLQPYTPTYCFWGDPARSGVTYIMLAANISIMSTWVTHSTSEVLSHNAVGEYPSNNSTLGAIWTISWAYNSNLLKILYALITKSMG